MNQLSPSKIVLFLSNSFIAGVALGSLINIPHVFLWAFLLLALILAMLAIIFRRNKVFLFGVCLFFLLLGIERFYIADFIGVNSTLNQLNGSGKITIIGHIIDEPDIRITQQKIKVATDDGVVLVTTTRTAHYAYLDTVKIIGKLESPPVFEDFNYKNYLLKDGIYSIASYPDIEIIPSKKNYSATSFLYEKLLVVKNQLKYSIESNFSALHASFIEGMVLGDNRKMTDTLIEQLNVTGLTHFTAVSGSNIIILSAVLVALVMFLGGSRRQAFYASISFVWLYITLTGLSASGVRAGIMGSIMLFAGYFGRQNTSQRNIILAGAIMLAQNPFLLAHDVGFQLSFLASMGIIYLKPSLDFLFNMLWKNKLRELLDAITATMAAQIFTLPIMVYNFGSLSLIALVTNILAAPVASWILVLGFLFALVATISQTLAFIFLIPLWGLVSYLLKIIEIFSQPWAIISFSKVSWLWLLAMYILIFGFTIFVRKKTSQEMY